MEGGGADPSLDMLVAIFDRQAELQQVIIGGHPSLLEGDERYRYVLSMAVAMHSEVDEVFREVHWKPWAKAVEHGAFKDRDAFLEEGVDLLHFLVNCFLLAGASPEEVFVAYMGKARANVQRQLDGYEG